MRALAIGLITALATAGLAGCGDRDAKDPDESAAIVAAPPATPARKAGLWKQTMSSGGTTPVELRVCTDAQMEKKMSWWGGGMAQGACTENTASKGPDGVWRFKSVCKAGTAGNSVTEGTMTGDFQTRYEIKGKTSTMGAATPGANGVHDVSVVAEWQGPCPADWMPGDTEMPGGMRMNTLAFEQIQKEIEAQQGR